MISVIVPNYNNEAYIEKCIDSIMMQMDVVFEVIVVDDASTDRSVQKLTALQQKYGENRLRLKKLEFNQGVSHARNVGIECATGEYITFLDADDYMYDAYKLKNEMDLICNYEKKRLDVAAYSEVYYTDELGEKVWNQKKRKAYNGFLFHKLLSTADTKIIPRDYIIKSEILKEVGYFREDMSLYEDYELTLRVAQKVPFYDTGKAGTVYRLKENGLSNKSKKESGRIFRKIFFQYLDGVKNPYRMLIFIFKYMNSLTFDLRNILYNIIKEGGLRNA